MKGRILVETHSGILVGSEIEITTSPDYVGSDGITYHDQSVVAVGRTPRGILSTVILGSSEYELIREIKDIANLKEALYEVLDPFINHNSEEEGVKLIDNLIKVFQKYEAK